MGLFVTTNEHYYRTVKESQDRAESLRLSQHYLSNCNSLLMRIRKALGISGIEDDGQTWFPNTEEAVKKIIKESQDRFRLLLRIHEILGFVGIEEAIERLLKKAQKLDAIERLLSQKIPTYGTANGSK